MYAGVESAVSCCAGLAELDIGDNKIGDVGAIALSKGLVDNSSLEQLSLVRLRLRLCTQMRDAKPFFNVTFVIVTPS